MSGSSVLTSAKDASTYAFAYDNGNPLPITAKDNLSYMSAFDMMMSSTLALHMSQHGGLMGEGEYSDPGWIKDDSIPATRQCF